MHSRGSLFAFESRWLPSLAATSAQTLGPSPPRRFLQRPSGRERRADRVLPRPPEEPDTEVVAAQRGAARRSFSGSVFGPMEVVAAQASHQ